MQKVCKLITENKIYFIGYSFVLIFGLTLLLILGKVGAFYALNPIHQDWINYIFYFFTILGDGFFCVPLGLSFLFIREKKICCLILSSYIVSGLLILILKSFITEARPSVFVGLKSYPYFIEHITLHNFHGFPSGHTASAFAIASILAFNSLSKKRIAVILLSIAVCIGYSRVYLGQHFISDVIAGSLIGLISAIYCWLVIDKYLKNKL